MRKPASWVYIAAELDAARYGRPPSREPLVMRLRARARQAEETGDNAVPVSLLEEAADELEALAGLQ